MACGILVPRPGIEPGPMAVKALSPNHWTVREFKIITLNVNGVNAPPKRHRLAEWIEKQDLYICCLQDTNFRSRD